MVLPELVDKKITEDSQVGGQLLSAYPFQHLKQQRKTVNRFIFRYFLILSTFHILHCWIDGKLTL